MKILFVTYFYEQDFGGAELIMRTLRRCLQERGHIVDVLCLAGGNQPQPNTVWRIPLPPVLIQHPHPTKRAFIFLNNPLFDVLLLRRTLGLGLNPAAYDIIHCQDIHGLRMGSWLARRHGKILGLTLQDNVPRELLGGITGPVATLLLRAALRWRDRQLRSYLRQCHWICAVSGHVGQKLIRFLAPNAPPVHTIYSPRPDNVVGGPESTIPAHPEPRFLYLGRLSREKGVDVLIEAFRRFDQPARLDVLGLAGPLKPFVEAAARVDPRIRLLPPVPHEQVHAYLQEHDVICCPSLWNDPLPGTVIEARLNQRVIVSTDCGGIPEILEHYAKAILIPTAGKNHEQMVQAILDGLYQAIHRMVIPRDSAQEQHFLDRFSAQRFVGEYEALYSGSLERPISPK